MGSVAKTSAASSSRSDDAAVGGSLDEHDADSAFGARCSATPDSLAGAAQCHLLVAQGGPEPSGNGVDISDGEIDFDVRKTLHGFLW